MKAAGADVIDLGCLPDTPFPHLEEAVRALAGEGYAVSVDSGDPDELRRGIGAGADFVLSLTEETLGLADDGPVVPVLIPARPGDLESLARAVERMQKTGRPFIADPVLDPIHLGFTEALVRYRELRRRFPEIEMLMGVGNLTELTDADTTGINAVLMGICSELAIRNVLVVRVSPHCRRAIEEADAARRLMFAAREAEAPPMDMSGLLTCLRDRRPFPSTPEEIAELAREIRDANYRIEVEPSRRSSLQSGRPPGRRRPVCPLSRSRRQGGRGACLLSRCGIGARRDRLPAGQALCSGPAARLGRGRTSPARGSLHLRAGGDDAGSEPTQEGTGAMIRYRCNGLSAPYPSRRTRRNSPAGAPQDEDSFSHPRGCLTLRRRRSRRLEGRGNRPDNSATKP